MATVPSRPDEARRDATLARPARHARVTVRAVVPWADEYRHAVALTVPQVPPNCDLTLGIVCIDKSRPGRTVWRMRAHERFANPLGVVQGGFLAACCDSAMGATVVTAASGRSVRVANTEMSVSFLRPVRVGAEVTCEATVVAGGSRVVFAEATLTAADPGGQPTLAARASSTYLILERT